MRPQRRQAAKITPINADFLAFASAFICVHRRPYVFGLIFFAPLRLCER
jgi:hypothetical protein